MTKVTSLKGDAKVDEIYSNLIGQKCEVQNTNNGYGYPFQVGYPLLVQINGKNYHTSTMQNMEETETTLTVTTKNTVYSMMKVEEQEDVIHE